MAFRQPLQQRRQIQRPTSIPHSLVAHDATHHGRVDESQEWILFSPQLEHEPSLTSYTSQTSHIQQAPGFSDFGSLETGDCSNQRQADDDGEVTCQGTEIDEEDEEELDSLDDGLHTFHPSFSLDQSGGAVLPNHDGMGSFPALYHNNDNVQEHLWQFERYNPCNRRRAQRRRNSVQRKFDILEELESDKQEERRLRVERWRLEQSRAVLEEIEKETRRRRKRLSIASRAASTAAPAADTETESFWQRVTRRVIQDLMGLDDTTLSVIFGEELAPAAQTKPTQQSPLTEVLSAHQDRVWENRLLNRIAKELGILANQLAENDRQDRTFSTYTPYKVEQFTPSQPRQIPPSTATAHSVDVPQPSSAPPLFAPTFANPPVSPAVEADTSLWGIPEQPQESAEEQIQPQDKDHETEYWERDLDIGVVFRYLRSRFTSRPPSPSPPESQPQQQQPPSQSILPADWASPSNAAVTASALGTSPESRRRADLIRRHHPLVSHAASVSAQRRRESVLLHTLLHRRAQSSSCASQSTKRTRSGGSRRYWDFPSSTGSVVSVGSTGEGVLGGWGEV
ncbi:hypothetical protein E4T49_01834 [Aureobasidium sp. EXF-10728]|nr:hypothetical protein E4T49_01834 [Aureobasidium sp. EXF-10728]